MKSLITSIAFCLLSCLVSGMETYEHEKPVCKETNVCGAEHAGITELDCMAERIGEILKGKKASVGVAVICEDRVLTLSNDVRYPLMSVFKFHIAVTALKKMEDENIPLDSCLTIKAEQMHKDTYSPLRDLYPDSDIRISFRDLLRYTVSYSDNNTCDILIDFCGGIGRVDSYIRSLGISGFSLTETETSMHKDIMNCYKNWSTPLSTALLLREVYSGAVIGREYRSFLEETMIGTTSGPDKLKAGLPEGTVLGHKTGHSDRTEDGMQIGDADAGAIYLPDGRICFITVYIMDSFESDEDNASIMASIAEVVY